MPKPTRYTAGRSTVEAIRFDGTGRCAEEIGFWMMQDETSSLDLTVDPTVGVPVETPQGRKLASPGDYVVRTSIGEFYRIGAELFLSCYREEQ